MSSSIALKKAVTERVHEDVFYVEEIASMLSNLNTEGHSSYNKIAYALRKSRVMPVDLGIDSYDFGVERNKSLYPATAVWAYLQRLESEHKINLEANEIRKFDDLLERNFHKGYMRFRLPREKDEHMRSVEFEERLEKEDSFK